MLSDAVDAGLFWERWILRWRRRPFSGGGRFVTGGSVLFLGTRIQWRRLGAVSGGLSHSLEWHGLGGTYWFIWWWGRLLCGIGVGAIDVDAFFVFGGID